MENKKKKNIVDEALLDIKVIQEALQKNTKEILRYTMKEEIDQLVKGFVTEEQGYDEEEIDTDTDAGEDTSDVDVDIDSDEFEAGEESGDELPVPMGGDDEPIDEPIDEPEMDYDELDMTAASDEDVIKVFKRLSAEDEIEIVSDTEIKITDPESGNEYVITTGEKPSELGGGKDLGISGIGMDIDEPEMDIDEPEMDIDEPEMDIDEPETDMDDTEFDTDESEEPVYEITLDEEIIRTAISDIQKSMSGTMPTGNIEGQKAEKSDVIDGDNLTGGFTEKDPNGKKDAHAEHVMEDTEDDIDESMAPTGTHKDTDGKRGQMGGQRHQTPETPRFNESVSKVKFNELLTVAKKLQAENKEVKKALVEFRKMLAESVVYNTNLTYMVKIITEHSTSKEEKQDIIKRFDNVNSLKESKRLYKTISSELGTKKSITESIEHKIEKTQTSGSSKKLNESTVYVDQSTQRIKDLISRVENKDKF